MKTSSKIFSPAVILLLSGIPALAGNKPLTCWYDAGADFTSATPAASGATIGSVEHSGSGDRTYSYTISARDGTACPVQLPLSTLTAETVALVRQDDDSCTNEKVSDAGEAVLGGSVTVSRETEHTNTAGIKLAGVTPNATYRIFLKCGRQLGSLRTDAGGNAGRTVDFSTDALGPAYAFEIVPDGAGQANKLESLTFKK